MTKFYNTLVMLLVLSCITACGRRYADDTAQTPKEVNALTSICTKKGLSAYRQQIQSEWSVSIRVTCVDKETKLQYSPTALQ